MDFLGIENVIPANTVPLRLVAYFMMLLSVYWGSRELRDVS